MSNQTFGIPASDSSNYFVPLSFGQCGQIPSSDLFEEALTGNKVTKEEFRRLFDEIKAAAQPFINRQTLFSWIYVLSTLIVIPGISIPICYDLSLFWPVASVVLGLVLMIVFIVKSDPIMREVRTAIQSVLDKHNSSTYNPRGVHLTLGQGQGQRLNYIQICLYYSQFSGNQVQPTQPTYSAVPDYSQQAFQNANYHPQSHQQQLLQQQMSVDNHSGPVSSTHPHYLDTHQLYPKMNQPLLKGNM